MGRFPAWGPQVMPALQALYLTGKYAMANLNIPWTQLTELEVDFGLESKQVLDVLNALPYLVRCSLRISEHGPGVLNAYPTFTLSHLKLFCLSPENVNIAAFFAPLILPALKELHVIDCIGEHWTGDWPTVPFTDLIVGSQCVLTHLLLSPNPFEHMVIDLNHFNGYDDRLELLFRELHAVTDLRIPAIIPSGPFELIMEHNLLPNLQHVSLVLDPAGILEFVDWLLTFEEGGTHNLRTATAVCHVGLRFMSAKKLFDTHKAQILKAGIRAEVLRIDESGGCGCRDPPTELDDLDFEWADDDEYESDDEDSGVRENCLLFWNGTEKRGVFKFLCDCDFHI